MRECANHGQSSVWDMSDERMSALPIEQRQESRNSTPQNSTEGATLYLQDM